MLKAVGKTDIGRRREANQDYFEVVNLSDTALCAVLCDGMGGPSGGNIASKMAVETISRQVGKGYQADMKESSARALLQTAVAAANAVVYEKSRQEPGLNGMGTTMEAALVCGREVHIAHIGDSSIYRIRRGGLEKLTKDHSLVQSLVDQGKLSPEDAQNHPQKHLITRALGVNPEVEMDYICSRLEDGEGLLLCSDGLTNHVDDAEIYDILSKGGEDCPGELIRQANLYGGLDNITAVVITL